MPLCEAGPPHCNHRNTGQTLVFLSLNHWLQIWLQEPLGSRAQLEPQVKGLEPTCSWGKLDCKSEAQHIKSALWTAGMCLQALQEPQAHREPQAHQVGEHWCLETCSCCLFFCAWKGSLFHYCSTQPSRYPDP